MAKNSSHSHHFIVPVQYYIGTFLALIILTVITVIASQIDLGSTTNIVIALLIAILKASLVASFFMGLKWDKKFNTLIIICSLVFFMIFIGFTASDVFTRHYDHELADERINLRNLVLEPGSGEHHNSDHPPSSSPKHATPKH